MSVQSALAIMAKTPPSARKMTSSNVYTTSIKPMPTTDSCHICNSRVYLMERIKAGGMIFHKK